MTLETTFGKQTVVMAPSSNSTKTLQQNRPRPTVPKAVIPAIPLPYIQKRRQQQAAREKATEEAIEVPQTAVVEAQTSPTPPTTEIAPSIVNGSSDSHATEKIAEVNELAIVDAATSPVAGEGAVWKSANGARDAYVEEAVGKQYSFHFN